MLYQVQDGQKKVIVYASRSLPKSKRNYPVHKLEFLALKWAITDKFHEYLYGSEFQVYTDSNPLTYVLTMTKLDATGHRLVAALSNYTFSIIYNKVRTLLMQMHYPTSGGLKPWRSTHRQCMLSLRVQAPHGKVDTLCHGAQVVDVLSQDNAPPGTTPLEWCQAQSKDPAIHQIIDGIQNKAIGKLKINGYMLSELKGLIRLKRQLVLKQGVLCRRTK